MSGTRSGPIVGAVRWIGALGAALALAVVVAAPAAAATAPPSLATSCANQQVPPPPAAREEAGRRSLGPLARETRILDGGTGDDVTLLGACALLLTRELGLTVHR